MRHWQKYSFILLMLFFSITAFAADKAFVLDINGPINPATQDYFKRGLATAVNQHAAVLILNLNTPGGLENSMRRLNEAIITSPLPIIAYVSPAGARAASAGTFIMYASHLAAMAPGTNIGAASPISWFNQSTANKTATLSNAEKKAVNDAAAYMRSLAQLRGRNADWADLAVRQAASLSATEAKQLKVIDEIAEDLPQLLQKIDGHTAMVLGNSEAVKTKNLELIKLPPDWRYQFLAFLTNPNIAYILMLIAIYGLFFELANPGLILPGVAGTISLLLTLYALQLMPINYTGLALICLGISFLIFEIYVSSFGALGIGGVIAFIIGSILLFDAQDPTYHVDWILLISTSLLTMTFFFIVINLAICSQRKKVMTGIEGLIGCHGVVLNKTNDHLTVKVLGEIWEAYSDHTPEVGEEIEVEKIQGLILKVKRITAN